MYNSCSTILQRLYSDGRSRDPRAVQGASVLSCEGPRWPWRRRWQGAGGTAAHRKVGSHLTSWLGSGRRARRSAGGAQSDAEEEGADAFDRGA